jgi:hypothetical protein
MCVVVLTWAKPNNTFSKTSMSYMKYVHYHGGHCLGMKITQRSSAL